MPPKRKLETEKDKDEDAPLTKEFIAAAVAKHSKTIEKYKKVLVLLDAETQFEKLDAEVHDELDGFYFDCLRGLAEQQRRFCPVCKQPDLPWRKERKSAWDRMPRCAAGHYWLQFDPTLPVFSRAEARACELVSAHDIDLELNGIAPERPRSTTDAFAQTLSCDDIKLCQTQAADDMLSHLYQAVEQVKSLKAGLTAARGQETAAAAAPLALPDSSHAAAAAAAAAAQTF